MPPSPEGETLSQAAIRLPLVAQHYADTVAHTHIAGSQRDRTFIIDRMNRPAGSTPTDQSRPSWSRSARSRSAA